MQYTINNDGTYNVNVLSYISDTLGPHRQNADNVITMAQKMCNYLAQYARVSDIVKIFSIGVPLIKDKLKTVVPIEDIKALRTNVNIMSQCLSQLNVLNPNSKTDPTLPSSPYSLVIKYVSKQLLGIQPYRCLPVSSTNNNPNISGEASVDDILPCSINQFFQSNSASGFIDACVSLYNTASAYYGQPTSYTVVPSSTTFTSTMKFTTVSTIDNSNGHFTIVQSGSTYTLTPLGGAVLGEQVTVNSTIYTYLGGQPLAQLIIYMNLFQTIVSCISGQGMSEYNTLDSFVTVLQSLSNIIDTNAIITTIQSIISLYNPTNTSLTTLLGQGTFKDGLLSLYSIYTSDPGLVLSILADINTYGALVISSAMRQYNNTTGNYTATLVAYVPQSTNIKPVAIGTSLGGSAAEGVNARQLCTILSTMADDLSYVMHFGVLRKCSAFTPTLNRKLFGTFVTKHYSNFVNSDSIAFSNDIVGASVTGNAAKAYQLTPVTIADIYSIGTCPPVNYYLYGCYDARVGNCLDVNNEDLDKLTNLASMNYDPLENVGVRDYDFTLSGNTGVHNADFALSENMGMRNSDFALSKNIGMRDADFTQYFANPSSGNILAELIAPLNDAVAISLASMSTALTDGAKMITNFKLPILQFPDLSGNPFSIMPTPDYASAIGRMVNALSQDIIGAASAVLHAGIAVLSDLENKLSANLVGEVIVALSTIVNSSIGAYYSILDEAIASLESLLVELLKKVQLKIEPKFNAVSLEAPAATARTLSVANIPTVQPPPKNTAIIAAFNTAFVDLLKIFDIVSAIAVLSVLIMIIIKLIK